MLPGEFDKNLAVIEAALAADDLPALRLPAHRMRGLVGALGAGRLDSLCRTLEAHARAGGDLAPTPFLPALRGAVAETMAGLAELRREPFPSGTVPDLPSTSRSLA